MIKFFRHIRRKLIHKDEMGKYLKYAIGEIILVVIGILLALQINNWSQDFQNSKKEKGFLKDMQLEFLEDKKMLDRFIQLTEQKKESGKEVQQFLKGDPIDRGLLLNHLFFNGKTLIFNSFTPVYDELLSSGQMGLIKNDSLKASIKDYKYYIKNLNDFLYRESGAVKEQYNLHLYQYFDHEIITILWEHRYSSKAIEDIAGLKADFDGFKNDPKSTYYVSMAIGTDSELNRLYAGSVKSRLDKILEVLENQVTDD